MSRVDAFMIVVGVVLMATALVLIGVSVTLLVRSRRLPARRQLEEREGIYDFEAVERAEAEEDEFWK